MEKTYPRAVIPFFLIHQTAVSTCCFWETHGTSSAVVGKMDRIVKLSNQNAIAFGKPGPGQYNGSSVARSMVRGGVTVPSPVVNYKPLHNHHPSWSLTALSHKTTLHGLIASVTYLLVTYINTKTTYLVTITPKCVITHLFVLFVITLKLTLVITFLRSFNCVCVEGLARACLLPRTNYKYMCWLWRITI